MDTNYLKTGNLTVNNVEIGYGIRETPDDLEPYAFEVLSADGDFLGDLPMSKDDYDNLNLIWLDDTVYSAAEDGLLPDVAEYCGIACGGE